MPKIVNSGLTYIQSQVAAGKEMDITQAVIAFVNGLDHTATIPDNTTTPATILETVNIGETERGAINPHSVVFSSVLDSTMGDYSYNWIGLVSATGELVAVETYPTRPKYKSLNERVGNTLVDNIILQFDNAQSISGITVTAQSWQYDFATEHARIEAKADAAQSTADTAAGAAATADGKTVNAQSTADAAKANAKTADDKADAAQSTANTAKANAKTADDKAVAAQGAADTAKNDANKALGMFGNVEETWIGSVLMSGGEYELPDGWSSEYKDGRYTVTHNMDLNPPFRSFILVQYQSIATEIPPPSFSISTDQNSFDIIAWENGQKVQTTIEFLFIKYSIY